MAQAIRSIHFTSEPAGASQAVEQVYADNLPSGGGEQTTIPEGALVPGAGIDLDRNDSGVITASVKAKGITAGMLADGVAVSGPKGDKGEPGTAGAAGAKGADGKSVKALALTVDANGKVTGGTMTLSDNSTVAVTVTTATA